MRRDWVYCDRREWWQESQAVDQAASTVKQKGLSNHSRTFLSSEHMDQNIHSKALLKENTRKKSGLKRWFSR